MTRNGLFLIVLLVGAALVLWLVKDPTALGFIGVSLLLLAFFLNLFQMLRSDSLVYISLNLVGPGLACYSSWLIQFMPFVLLEGVWAIVAAVALGRYAYRQWNATRQERPA
jgi:hypothetical protein